MKRCSVFTCVVLSYSNQTFVHSSVSHGCLTPVAGDCTKEGPQLLPQLHAVHPSSHPSFSHCTMRSVPPHLQLPGAGAPAALLRTTQCCGLCPPGTMSRASRPTFGVEVRNKAEDGVGDPGPSWNAGAVSAKWEPRGCNLTSAWGQQLASWTVLLHMRLLPFLIWLVLLLTRLLEIQHYCSILIIKQLFFGLD